MYFITILEKKETKYTMLFFKDYLTVPSMVSKPPLLTKLKSPLQTDPPDTPPAPPDI